MATYDNQWIIRYVDGELSPEELGAFEAALQTDTELAAEVERYRDVKAVLQERLPEDATREALVRRTARLNREYFAPQAAAPPSRRTPILRRLAPIAAAACILVAAVLLWPGDYDHKLDQLGNTAMIGITERGVQTDSLLQEAAVFFNQQQFEKALPLLNGAVVADTSSQLALFYLGIAAWHTGDLPLARSSLQQVFDRGSVLKNDAAFYMALTYAREKNKPLALEWLRKIPTMAPERLKANELENLLK